MEPYHDGAFLSVFGSRRPDVQVLAVIVCSGLIARRPPKHTALRGDRSCLGCVADAFPALRRFRRYKPLLRAGIGNAQILIDAVFYAAPQHAVLSLHDCIVGRLRRPDLLAGKESTDDQNCCSQDCQYNSEYDPHNSLF